MSDGGAAEVVLFTDVDGTLIDHTTYRPGPARAALHDLVAAGVEVVLCSNKTAAELRSLCDELAVRLPFIVENGGAVHDANGDELRRSGFPYAQIRAALHDAARDVGLRVAGYGDMTDESVARLTGLAERAAARARDRHHSETFLVTAGNGDVADLAATLAGSGIALIQGARFITAVGHHDKADAVRWYCDEVMGAGVRSYAVGDGPNDLGMLATVDVPMLVRAHHGDWIDARIPGLVRLDGIGPAGFVLAAERVLGDRDWADSCGPAS